MRVVSICAIGQILIGFVLLGVTCAAAPPAVDRSLANRPAARWVPAPGERPVTAPRFVGIGQGWG